ncbi:MAG: trypsin-like serine protease [Clostridiales bacterium]|nr:trypsin-like serine protease [Clostridiales bacterium]
MDDNKKDTSEYEPNFILGSSEQEPAAEPELRSKPTSEPDPIYEGGYCDPRANFKNSGVSCSWDNKNGTGRVKKPHIKKSANEPISFTRKSLALLIALCLVLSGLFGFGGAVLGANLLNDSNGSDKASSATPTGYTLEDATGSNLTIQEITDAAKPSVVEIKTESVASDSWMQQYVTEGAGSGVIITNDGYIITNNHVIDGASKITVTAADEKEYSAELIGTDSISDVAVLKIDAKNLTPATYGNSTQLDVGDIAVAIGNPLGELGGTVTAGIISALDRQLSIDGKTMTLLQTDSSINPGNSGGGLFNGDGQLVGIVVAKSSGSDVEGLGFAIPINTAADVTQQLMEKGYVSGQPSTGMTYTESSGQQGGLDSFLGGGTTSVYIQSVNSNNAKTAGFKAGDMVYAVDDEVISSFNVLSSIVTSHKVGDKLKFSIVRNGKTMNINLTLEEKTSNQ